MKNPVRIVTEFLIIISTLAGCGDSGKTEKLTGFFPEEFDGLDLVRSSEINSFKGEALFEYINGGAEIYHLYDFVEVATAFYKTGENELVLDVYQFGDPDNAYGLYSSLKPSGPGNIALGVEGFTTENSIDFVKGKYLVRVVGYDESEDTKNAVKNLATTVEKTIPGTVEMPSAFAGFPTENLVLGSERMHAESFMGRIFLTDVYTKDYDISGDAATLFTSSDETGEKYMKWLENERSRGKADSLAGGFEFESGNSFMYTDDYRGTIIAGLKNGKLAGITGYKESHREFLARWLESLK